MAELPSNPDTPSPAGLRDAAAARSGSGARGGPPGFVNPRPALSREDSSAQLCASQQNSSANLIEDSQLNPFDTAAPPKTETAALNPKGMSLWHRRSKLEKALLVACGTLLLIVLIMSCLALVRVATPESAPHASESAHTSDSSLCLNPACIHTASSVLASLDPDKDPCHDFYEFACGGWIRNNPLPDGKSSWNYYSQIWLQNHLIIRNALEQINSTKPSSAEAKAKIYYDACLDSNETIEALGATPLLDVIKKLGGWHLLPETMQKLNRVSMQKMLQLTKNRYNIAVLFGWGVVQDRRNSSEHVIALDQGGLNLPTREYYLNKTANKKILEAYLEFMTRICVLLGANKIDAKAHMQKVIDFETELANITTPKEESRDDEKLYNLITIAELQKAAPFINWLAFFNDAFNQVNKSITEKERVLVFAPEYFKKLTTILNRFRRTEDGQKVVTSYMMWMASRSLLSYLSKSFRDANKIFSKALDGSEGTEKSWRYCVIDTTKVLGSVSDAMFVRSMFHGESKTQGQLMMNNIRGAFKDNFGNLRWMDTETRLAAEIKADAITNLIGFPDYILDPVELDKKYAELEVVPYKYFTNNIHYKLLNLKNNFLKLDKPVNKTKWGVDLSEVNAYYTRTNNQIGVAAGFLQRPFYDSDNPHSVNYGALGAIMGHELTHAFDDQGRLYDRFGNLNQWWNNATIEQFKKRTTCMQQQYSNYTLEGFQLNGKLTLGENIADNGGLKAAYHAYVAQARNAPRNLTLPGLHYTHTQMFFISFAQVRCAAMKKESIKFKIEDDVHTVDKYRVIGPLSNLKEFAQEFRCPAGSKMNPRDKCEVW